MRTFRTSTDSARRPLFIDFDAYTDGDPEFKKEITDLMIDNLQEMQQVLGDAIRQNDVVLFQRVCHKIKATLDMLEDRELLDLVQLLKADITNADQASNLDRICGEIIISLHDSK
jgi:hypothetical protein